MSEFEVKFHPEFFDDLKRLDKRDLKAIYKQVEKIKKNPKRFKRLIGRENVFRVRVGKLRLVYYVERKTIWFLVVEKRDKVYETYYKRLYKIKSKLLK